MNRDLLGAVWTLVGIIIGAGVFGLPFVFYKAGFYTGLVMILIAFGVMTLITLYLGEICLRTKGKHQLTGLAGIYLGKKGRAVMFVANVLSIYGALAAYIIGGGAALGSVFGSSSLLFSILFFVFVAPVVYFSVRIIEGFESLFSPLKIAIVIILSFILLKFIDFSNISSFNLSLLILPYGVSIFALAGLSAVPEMNEELRNKKYMKSAIIVGMLIGLIVQLLFVFSVVGAIGEVGEIATVSLSAFGTYSNIFANLFALFAMATAFVALGFALKENFTLDFLMPNFPSWILVVLIPFAVVMSGFLGFVELLELTGAIGVGIILSLILFMHTRAKKIGNREPEYSMADNSFIKAVLFLVLLVGIVYSVFWGL